jgi:hypothetical protein
MSHGDILLNTLPVSPDSLSETERFFFEHAGASYHPATETLEQGKVRGARQLAMAEDYAEVHGWHFTLDIDSDGPMPDDVDSVGSVERGEAVCLSLVLYGPDPDAADTRVPFRGRVVLGSLHNIIVPNDSDPYLRVVAAELALDAMPDDVS